MSQILHLPNVRRGIGLSLLPTCLQPPLSSGSLIYCTHRTPSSTPTQLVFVLPGYLLSHIFPIIPRNLSTRRINVSVDTPQRRDQVTAKETQGYCSVAHGMTREHTAGACPLSHPRSSCSGWTCRRHQAWTRQDRLGPCPRTGAPGCRRREPPFRSSRRTIE